MVTKKKGLEDTSGAYQYSFKKTTENSTGDNYIISIQLHYIVIKTECDQNMIMTITPFYFKL